MSAWRQGPELEAVMKKLRASEKNARGPTYPVHGGQLARRERAVHTPSHQCPKCRAEVFQGACFCMQCGTRLEGPRSLPSSVRLKTPETPARGRLLSDTGYSVTTRRVGGR